MCKGSGMIHPNMCTMLSFLMTDAAISKEMLQKALSADVDDTYNMISVDGDTSTNDTVLLLANGLAERIRKLQRKAKIIRHLPGHCTISTRRSQRKWQGTAKVPLHCLRQK